MAEITVGVSRQITVDRLVCRRWIVDLEAEKVTAEIVEADPTGSEVGTFEVTFWRNTPPGEPLYDDEGTQIGVAPNPETWFDLPAGRAAELVELTDEILAAVKARMY